jgi:hypothetical protein
MFCINGLTVVSIFWTQAWDRASLLGQGRHPELTTIETAITPSYLVVGIRELSLRVSFREFVRGEGNRGLFPQANKRGPPEIGLQADESPNCE